jgi:hypothetical protein
VELAAERGEWTIYEGLGFLSSLYLFPFLLGLFPSRVALAELTSPDISLRDQGIVAGFCPSYQRNHA